MLLVTGATGNIGRALVSDLTERGVEFRSLVRDPARATGPYVVGDLNEPLAFDGFDRLFLLTQGIGTGQTANAIAAARAAGVKHIVHLSSFHLEYDPIPAM